MTDPDGRIKASRVTVSNDDFYLVDRSFGV